MEDKEQVAEVPENEMIYDDNVSESFIDVSDEHQADDIRTESVETADSVPQTFAINSTRLKVENVIVKSDVVIVKECRRVCNLANVTRQKRINNELLPDKRCPLDQTKQALVTGDCFSQTKQPTVEQPKTIVQVRNATSKINCIPTDSPCLSTSCRSFCSPSASPLEHPTVHIASGGGAKYKLIREGDMKLCRLNHTRTVVSKIMNSKYLRRWECHHLNLGECEIFSTTVGYPSDYFV